MKDSGVEWIGEIPEHWQLKKIKYVSRLISEKVSSKSSKFQYIGMENIESWSGTHVETNAEIDGLASKFIAGDILFGKLRPYLAKVFLCKSEGICSTELLVYRTKLENKEYLTYLMRSNAFINLINASTYGSKMPRANSNFIGNQVIGLPSMSEQKKIVSFIEIVSEKINTGIVLQQQQIEKLKEYKSTLINSAVTGKIKVV